MTEPILLTAILIVLVALYFVIGKFRKTPAGSENEHDHHDSADGVCCGRHAVCDKGFDKSSLYFDDEELDRFKERKEEDYTDDEVEEFRQVLYTMREEEVDQWVKCLATRHIALPQQIKDEILLMLQ